MLSNPRERPPKNRDRRALSAPIEKRRERRKPTDQYRREKEVKKRATRAYARNARRALIQRGGKAAARMLYAGAPDISFSRWSRRRGDINANP